MKKLKRKKVFIVKTTTEGGADTMVKSGFKSREAATTWKDQNREDFPRELYVEPFSY